MSRQLADLEQTLSLMIVEHRKLLEQVDAQQFAMRQMQPEVIDQITGLQETTRLRIATLDKRRRVLMEQLGKLLKIPGDPTLAQLAKIFPPRAAEINAMREELKSLAEKIQAKNSIASRLAGAVLGHFENTAVRLIAGAVEQAGVYTKNGTPKVAARIGAIEAIG